MSHQTLPETDHELEERVAALEQRMNEVQIALRDGKPVNWLDAVSGIVTDPEGFDEVLKYGREFRTSGIVPVGDSNPS